jgi:hypothetical protein
MESWIIPLIVSQKNPTHDLCWCRFLRLFIEIVLYQNGILWTILHKERLFIIPGKSCRPGVS